jgi:hypothetical protein
MAAGNTNFTTLITTTLQNHGKQIFDAVTTNVSLLWMLKKAGNIKISSGGRQFTHPIIYQKNSSFQMYNKLDTIALPVTDSITRAAYDIKVAAGSIVLPTIDLAMNAGSREKLLDYADVKRQEAEISMSELLGGTSGVWGDLSPTTEFGGLPYLITSNTSVNTTNIGGINSSTSGNTYWRNQFYNTAITAFNTSSTGLTQWNALLNRCTFGTQGPKAVFTDKTIYGLYEIGLTSNIRYTSTDLAVAGFKHLMYTTMPVLFDDNCITGDTFFVDTDSLWLQVLAQANNRITQFQLKDDQLASSALMYLAGNLTCGSLRTQGIIASTTG